MKKGKFGNFFDILLDFFEITIIGTTVFILVYLFVGQLLEVTGDSMYPTLKDKEQLIAEKVSVKFKPLERDEIVIFRHPTNNARLLIKRVVGLPGETIKISSGNVYINSSLLSEPYLEEGTETIAGKEIIENAEYEIGVDKYVLLGDNRKESSDSRTFGAVPLDMIIGRALLVYYPFSNFRILQH